MNLFLKGPDEYGDERMIKQIRRFVPAVETFVVSHNNDPYYYRWLECDVINAQQSGHHVNCCEQESPLLRSQIITDQLLGHIKDSDHNGFVWILLPPLTVFNCDNVKCDIYTTSFADWVPSSPSSLKFYKIAVEKLNVVIGYRTNGKRYIFLPDAVWEWIGLCANQQDILAYNTLDIKGADGYSKIYWNMQSTGDNRYSFSHVNEKNENKFFVISKGLDNLYYGWSNCLSSSLNMVPTFSGDWR